MKKVFCKKGEDFMLAGMAALMDSQTCFSFFTVVLSFPLTNYKILKSRIVLFFKKKIIIVFLLCDIIPGPFLMLKDVPGERNSGKINATLVIIAQRNSVHTV